MTGATGGCRWNLRGNTRGGGGRSAAFRQVHGQTGLGARRDPGGGRRVEAGGDARHAAPLRLVAGGQTGSRGGGRDPGSRSYRWLNIQYVLGATPGLTGVRQCPYRGRHHRSSAMQQRRGNLSILDTNVWCVLIQRLWRCDRFALPTDPMRQGALSPWGHGIGGRAGGAAAFGEPRGVVAIVRTFKGTRA